MKVCGENGGESKILNRNTWVHSISGERFRRKDHSHRELAQNLKTCLWLAHVWLIPPPPSVPTVQFHLISHERWTHHDEVPHASRLGHDGGNAAAAGHQHDLDGLRVQEVVKQFGGLAWVALEGQEKAWGERVWMDSVSPLYHVLIMSKVLSCGPLV